MAAAGDQTEEREEQQRAHGRSLADPTPAASKSRLQATASASISITHAASMRRVYADPVTREVAVLAALGVAACGFDPLDRCGTATPGDHLQCPMPGWLDRAFDLDVPAGWDGSSPVPVIIAFHGGGGNRSATSRITCPGGDLDDPGCLPAVAGAAGMAVVRPDGTGSRPIRNVRTWNGGGGVGDWQCTSGPACKAGEDDIGYVDELLAEVGRILPVDDRRIYATGISNGGAMTHRLACERPGRIAAIAPVGGGNQHAIAGGPCDGAVAVLDLHGTEDPCWTYDTSALSCLQTDGKLKVGVAETMDGWAQRNGCTADAPAEEAIADADPDDGTTSVRLRWQGCAAATELIRIDGGGHTWPDGYQYTGSDRVGITAHDFDADVLIVDFFQAHARP